VLKKRLKKSSRNEVFVAGQEMQSIARQAALKMKLED
jgi:hypothetical protein